MTALRLHVRVIPYDKEWPKRFEDEADRLRAALPQGLVAIHHIGSTSVRGLAAKPIIDIMPEVVQLKTVDEHTPSLEALGYIAKGEYGIPGRRFFYKGETDRAHHIHVFEQGSHGLKRHLAFRDYLRAHPEEARRYASIKKRLAEKFPFDIDGYCEGKHDYLQTVEKTALKWSQDSAT